MPVYKVWDELNAEEADARTIATACGPARAAVIYAEGDQDGHADGLYIGECDGGRNAQPISVRAPDGSLHRFKVYGVFSVDYYADEVQQPQDKAASGG